MAEVFAGHAVGEHGFRKPVAIKRLHRSIADAPILVRRLIDEAKLVASMQHGNIVRVVDLVRDEKDVLLVMELMDGPSVRQLMNRHARLSFGLAAYIVEMAATGLGFAHDQNVIHADVSPSNILLTRSGEVRVADFGIARRRGEGTLGFEGKWTYMAPERAHGGPATPRTDVFALGVVLYQILADSHPFARGSMSGAGFGRQALVPLRELRPDAPRDLEELCARALAPNPRARFASMRELVSVLTDVRFKHGWRDGASELSQLIDRAGVPRSPARSMTVITGSAFDAVPVRSDLDPDTAAHTVVRADETPAALPARTSGPRVTFAAAVILLVTILAMIAAVLVTG